MNYEIAQLTARISNLESQMVTLSQMFVGLQQNFEILYKAVQESKEKELDPTPMPTTSKAGKSDVEITEEVVTVKTIKPKNVAP